MLPPISALTPPSEIALARVPGASLKEIELEYEYPVTVYEGELIRDNMEYEFKIDAYTGEIVKWEEEVSDHHQYPAETPQTAPDRFRIRTG